MCQEKTLIAPSFSNIYGGFLQQVQIFVWGENIQVLMEYHVVVLQTQYVSAKEAHSHSLYIFLPPASQYITIFLSPRALPLDWSMGTCYSKNTEYLLLFGGIFFGGCLWGGGLFGVYQKIVEGGCATSVKSKEYFALYPLSDQIKKHTHSYPFHV